MVHMIRIGLIKNYLLNLSGANLSEARFVKNKASILANSDSNMLLTLMLYQV